MALPFTSLELTLITILTVIITYIICTHVIKRFAQPDEATYKSSPIHTTVTITPAQLDQFVSALSPQLQKHHESLVSLFASQALGHGLAVHKLEEKLEMKMKENLEEIRHKPFDDLGTLAAFKLTKWATIRQSAEVVQRMEDRVSRQLQAIDEKVEDLEKTFNDEMEKLRSLRNKNSSSISSFREKRKKPAIRNTSTSLTRLPAISFPRPKVINKISPASNVLDDNEKIISPPSDTSTHYAVVSSTEALYTTLPNTKTEESVTITTNNTNDTTSLVSPTKDTVSAGDVSTPSSLVEDSYITEDPSPTTVIFDITATPNTITTPATTTITTPATTTSTSFDGVTFKAIPIGSWHPPTLNQFSGGPREQEKDIYGEYDEAKEKKVEKDDEPVLAADLEDPSAIVDQLGELVISLGDSPCDTTNTTPAITAATTSNSDVTSEDAESTLPTPACATERLADDTPNDLGASNSTVTDPTLSANVSQQLERVEPEPTISAVTSSPPTEEIPAEANSTTVVPKTSDTTSSTLSIENTQQSEAVEAIPTLPVISPSPSATESVQQLESTENNILEVRPGLGDIQMEEVEENSQAPQSISTPLILTVQDNQVEMMDTDTLTPAIACRDVHMGDAVDTHQSQSTPAPVKDRQVEMKDADIPNQQSTSTLQPSSRRPQQQPNSQGRPLGIFSRLMRELEMPDAPSVTPPSPAITSFSNPNHGNPYGHPGHGNPNFGNPNYGNSFYSNGIPPMPQPPPPATRPAAAQPMDYQRIESAYEKFEREQAARDEEEKAAKARRKAEQRARR